MARSLTKSGVSVDDWLTDDGLLLLESWARDGYTMTDIANKIGIDNDCFLRWKDRYPEIRKAVSKGKELVDYQVENALLKSALGYKTKEVKVTTTMRYGKVVETIKEVTDKEITPNVSAIQMWLYNRNKDKWKNMNNAKGMFDDMEEDSSIEITVTRANKNETTNGDAPSASEEDTDFDIGVEESVVEEKEIKVRKRTKAETEAVEKTKKEEKEKKKKQAADTVVDESDNQEVDLDEWPDDWEDDDEDN